MSDGINGSGPAKKPLAEQVAAGLLELAVELQENRRAMMVQEKRITGLAQVLLNGVPAGDGARTPVVFMDEHAEQVADVITQQGDLDHQRGSKMYERAESFRRMAKGG